jgi:signal transduction histidine kinase
MQVRMLLAAATLLLLPGVQVKNFLLVLNVVAVSWIAARYWHLIVPRLLRHPLLVATDVVLGFAILGTSDPLGPFFMTTLVTAAVAGLLYRWQGMLIVSTLQVLCYYVTLGSALMNGESGVPVLTFQQLLGQPAFYPLIGFAGVGLRRLFDERAELERARREAELAAAAAEERTRLARDMHDSLAKTLRGIALSAAALPAWAARDSKRAAAEAERIVAAIEVASREARTIITGLRDESMTRPLPEAVRTTAKEWGEEHDIAVECAIDSAADLPQEARYEALGILSEALANIERHAEATEVEVRLSTDDDAVRLSVRDNGRGFIHETDNRASLIALARGEHYGLIGLHERAERVGGVATVVSAPGEGTSVTVEFPHAVEASSNGVLLAEVG